MKKIECKKAAYLIVVLFFCHLFLLNSAFANNVQDTFGAGPRVKAMGSAGTALSDNYSAVFYNPSRLTSCGSNKVSLSYNHIDYDISLKTKDKEYPKPDKLDSRDSFEVGFCVNLPLNLSFGFLSSGNIQQTAIISQTSINDSPHYVMYGKWLDIISLIAGGAIKIMDIVSLGLSVSVLANSDLLVHNEVPLVTEEELKDEWIWKLTPTVALYAGATLELPKDITIGLVYRSSIYHKLATTASTPVEFSGVLFEFDLYLESVAWYSPAQAAIGITHEPIDSITLAADITWYKWSAYPGPFIIATAEGESGVANTIKLPERESPDFKDIIVPRFGMEYIHNNQISARLGYSLRSSPAPLPEGRDNILDSDTHGFSSGLGYTWDLASYYKEDKPYYNPKLTIDTYFVLYFMSEREVNKKEEQQVLNSYKFGGTVFDMGVSITMSY